MSKTQLRLAALVVLALVVLCGLVRWGVSDREMRAEVVKPKPPVVGQTNPVTEPSRDPVQNNTETKEPARNAPKLPMVQISEYIIRLSKSVDKKHKEAVSQAFEALYYEICRLRLQNVSSVQFDGTNLRIDIAPYDTAGAAAYEKFHKKIVSVLGEEQSAAFDAESGSRLDNIVKNCGVLKEVIVIRRDPSNANEYIVDESAELPDERLRTDYPTLISVQSKRVYHTNEQDLKSCEAWFLTDIIKKSGL